MKWQRYQEEANERHVRNKLVKYLEDSGHLNVQPVCFKKIYGLPNDPPKELDAGAIAEGCAMVAEHKNVVDLDSVHQVQDLIKFIE